MIDALTLVAAPPSRRTRRALVAVVTGAIGLGLVAMGAALPWVVLFRGLQPQPGFLLDGGKLAGIAVASMAALVVGARYGGGLLIRPAVIVANLVVLADSLLISSRVGAYVADAGPAGALIQPSAGPGAVVMAVGAALLVVCGSVAPQRADRLPKEHVQRLLLASTLFVAGWIHLLLTPEHVAESAILGGGFLLSGLVQVVLAGFVLARRHDWTIYATVAVNAALITMYAAAVLVGLPFGADDHHAAGLVLGAGEPIDVFGATTTVAQVAGILLALRQLSVSPRGVPEKPTTRP